MVDELVIAKFGEFFDEHNEILQVFGTYQEPVKLYLANYALQIGPNDTYSEWMTISPFVFWLYISRRPYV